MRHRYTPLFAFLLATLLAACGQHPSPAVTGKLVTITLRTDTITKPATKPVTKPTTNLAPQGVPSDNNGDSAVKYLEISVFEGQEVVHFDNENSYDPTGSKTILSLEAGVSSITLKLPTSSSGYTFKAKALRARAALGWPIVRPTAPSATRPPPSSWGFTPCWVRLVSSPAHRCTPSSPVNV